MSERKHPTRVIYHHDPASLPAELHAQYEVRQAPRTIVPEGAEPSISDTVSDSYFGTVGPREIPWPLPPRFARGLLQRDVPRRLWFLDETYAPPTIAHTVVIDDGGPSIITDGPSERPPSILLADTASGSVSAAAICLPLPSVPFDFAAHRGRLVRDDAACGWRFEPAVRDE